MTDSRLPRKKLDNARLREMDRDGALLMKIYCPNRHLQAGVMWNGTSRVYLVAGDGFGVEFTDQPQRHVVVCPCSAARDFVVDTSKVWQVFYEHADNWRNRARRDRTISLDYEDMAWRD